MRKMSDRLQALNYDEMLDEQTLHAFVLKIINAIGCTVYIHSVL